MADLMGDLMGVGDDGDELSLVGEEGGEELGIRLARALPAKGRTLRLPQRPGWRAQLAPGVGVPRESMEPLPLVPQTNGGTFTSTIGAIRYTARPQRPYRGERLVAVVTRVGPSAGTVVPVLSGGLIVGTTVQQAQIGDVPLEIFAPASFGVRLSLGQAEPGVEVTAPVSLIGGGLVSPDTLTATLTLIGRSIQA